MSQRFQFSVTTLLLTVSGVAVVLALGFRAESAISTLILIALIFTYLAFITITLVYGGDSYRPFCIGAAFPLALLFVDMAQDLWFMLDDIGVTFPRGVGAITPNEALGTAILASIVLGYLCVGFRWLMTRPSSEK